MNTEVINILLVDDDPLIYRVVQQVLDKSSEPIEFIIETVENLAGALELLNQKSFDIVLLDLGLPDSSGIDTVKKVHASNPNVPVVVLTGSSDEMGVEAIKEGADDYLVKGKFFKHLAVRTIRYTLERKKAENALATLNKDLEVTVKKLYLSNRELENFVYVASHDLREPLRKISAFGELLQESLEDNLDDDQRENLEFMIDGSHRMQQMIEALLVHSRVNTRGATFREVDLNTVVEQLKNLELAVQLEESKGDILVPEPLPVANADAVQIRQLFQNLISNALKYRRKDILPRITIRASQGHDGMVQIEIEDNGIGIKEEYHKDIFNMFRRIHSRTDYDGVGIGLSVCKRIVERHNGEIGVKSAFGKGSTFWFTLPKAEISIKTKQIA
ncbi:MAG TPA: response regulator [Phycisphaerales bacterium]|nr:response regulator [Phycisphaerales bacterium]